MTATGPALVTVTGEEHTFEAPLLKSVLEAGGAGPAFVIYPRDDYPELQSEDDAK